MYLPTYFMELFQQLKTIVHTKLRQVVGFLIVYKFLQAEMPILKTRNLNANYSTNLLPKETRFY